MVNVTTDKATRELITSMASQIQTTATKAFDLYITGLRVEAGLNLAAAIATLVTTYLSARKAYRWADETQFARSHDESDNMFMAGLVGFIALVVAAFVFSALSNMALTLIIPEYTAMQNVIQGVQ